MKRTAQRPRTKSQQWESNPQPPHYECGALPIEAMLAALAIEARSPETL